MNKKQSGLRLRWDRELRKLDRELISEFKNTYIIVWRGRDVIDRIKNSGFKLRKKHLLELPLIIEKCFVCNEGINNAITGIIDDCVIPELEELTQGGK